MTANPWDKFFWNDWENDPALKLCSLAAQGLWMRILCICAKADPKGYLLVAGRPLSPSDLSSLVGKPVPEVETLLSELSRNGVFSTDRTGRIYNRRMLRAAKIARTHRENGTLGGNPKLLKQMEISRSDNPPVNVEVKPHKPEAISQKQQTDDGGFAAFFEAYPKRVDRLDAEKAYRSALKQADAGTLLAAALAYRHQQAATERKFIKGPAAWLRAGKWADEGLLVQSATFVPTDAQGWRSRMRLFHENGTWHPKWGPLPTEQGCKCPPDILAERQAA